MKSTVMLDRGGKRAGNAHDRRRVPPASEQRQLARLQQRRMADRRRVINRREAPKRLKRAIVMAGLLAAQAAQVAALMSQPANNPTDRAPALAAMLLDHVRQVADTAARLEKEWQTAPRGGMRFVR